MPVLEFRRKYALSRAASHGYLRIEPLSRDAGHAAQRERQRSKTGKQSSRATKMSLPVMNASSEPVAKKQKTGRKSDWEWLITAPDAQLADALKKQKYAILRRQKKDRDAKRAKRRKVAQCATLERDIVDGKAAPGAPLGDGILGEVSDDQIEVNLARKAEALLVKLHTSRTEYQRSLATEEFLQSLNTILQMYGSEVYVQAMLSVTGALKSPDVDGTHVDADAGKLAPDSSEFDENMFFHRDEDVWLSPLPGDVQESWE
ncbi:hypothetical protein FVE85_6398 [Porphyridium purpureum]|uniref:Uncharacterized protein n=1 Tax=Porphyridium purpureum TaxID=35688 RepID=A0A5J4Z7K2_PORPP|nr:hypothetical protein FVE85_6398 [Porphyridium purpureum]|eukprot:POR1435..scf295_1